MPTPTELRALEVIIDRAEHGDPVSSYTELASALGLTSRSRVGSLVAALEGEIAPVECITSSPDGSVHCSLELDAQHVCTTKVLWTRVRGAIVQTLEQTTLAALVPAPDLIQLVPLPPEKPVAA